jgi:SAM-dependent methyltransferase
MSEAGLARLAAILRGLLRHPVVPLDGALQVGGVRVPFTRGVVRFRADDGYNASFALQWKRFRLEQYDHLNGTRLTAERYMRETGWPVQGLDGELVLEAGCGAGRFTRVLAETGATLVSLDYSSAVDVSAEVNGGFDRVVFAQADILELPFREGAFDRVFCHGVLQHTPDPEAAFRCLRRMLRPGGLMSIDVYHRDGRVRPWKAKYLWRPLTTRLSPERLLGFLQWFIPLWLPFDTMLKSVPLLGPYLGALVPCWNYAHTPLPRELQRNWAIMDTFDALAPAHDHPVRMSEVERWFREGGFAAYEVREGGNGVVGNGRAS